MDYIFFSSLAGTKLDFVTVSYDIACQWSLHLMARMQRLPVNLHLPNTLKVRYRVPKFHLPAHVQKCWAPFSLNFSTCVGRTDGEGMEWTWSTLNGVARCVSMMGQGGRMDTLDDLCNDHNWIKTIATGACTPLMLSHKCSRRAGNQLLRKLTLAIPEAVVHHPALTAFSDGIRLEHGDIIGRWEQQVLDWEMDNTRFCPYDLPDEST